MTTGANIQGIKVMHLQDGDIIVLHVDEASIDEVILIGKAVKAVVGDHPIIVLERDMDIQILRPEQLPARLRNL